MKVYEVNTRIRGIIYTEDGDCGVLHDIETYPEDEYFIVEGTYTFNVVADNDDEVLSRAEEVFATHWESGKVDCGDVEETDQVTDDETYVVSECLGDAETYIREEYEEE